ncbi:TadE/TadG family type IV pilus assembly protein [Mangrovicella endophytica]|uniref:TadE/TadG family type IV pilus assembly protein n=1 Tax=Mangrovicella endophytica TaxID=2066697 RepID=UPI000C9E17D2|nr:TadE/TadG family type IV pilus assembly protein [Mangrovicella endophytica]
MTIFDRFRHDAKGNFAVITALLAVPLVFGMGAAIDLARSQNAQTRLQDAIDSAALAVVKDSGFDQTKANDIAAKMVKANYGTSYSDLTVQLTSWGAVVTAKTVVPNTLSGIFDFVSLNATVSGTVQYPPTKYEIVLVLDTTGSMEGTKIKNMRDAASKMVDALTDTEIMRRRVSFALVPFANYVNVGKDKATASWIDKDGLLQEPGSIIPVGVSRIKMFKDSFGIDWPGCVQTRLESGSETYSVDDTTPSTTTPRTLFLPVFTPDEPSTTSWGSKIYPNDYMADSSLKGLGVVKKNGVWTYSRVSKNYSYRFYSNVSTPQGPDWDCDIQPITALTNDYAKVKSQIAKLEASGSTNITEGVSWGMRVLSPGEPFTEGLATTADVQKIMVLLTDGDNSITRLSNTNKSAYSSMGYIKDGRYDGSYKSDSGAYTVCRNNTLTSDGNCTITTAGTATPPSESTVLTAMNKMTSAACEYAKKSAKMEVYTIRLEVDSSESSTLLSNCATDASHYYDAPDSSKLQEIFDDIASRIRKLQITS